MNRSKFAEAYGVSVRSGLYYERHEGQDSAAPIGDSFDIFAGTHKQTGDYYAQGGSRYGNEPLKRSIRRKLSLSSISHIWSR